MPKPRVQFSARQMMVLVAILALMSLLGRTLWHSWLQRSYSCPVRKSQLSATCGNGLEHVLAPGSLVAATVTYDFQFDSLRHKPGTTAVLLASVWLEDTHTRRYVDGYTFDASITIGAREAASGEFVWEGVVPRPGRYRLRTCLWHVISSNELKFVGWHAFGGTTYDFIDAKDSGAAP